MPDIPSKTSHDGQPRLFWRRALAFLVDIVLCFVAINLVILALTALSPVNLGFGAFETTECRPAPESAVARQVDREWPLEYGYVRTQVLCGRSILFDATSYAVIVTTAKRIGFAARTARIIFPSDETGAPLPPAAPAVSDWLAVLAAYAPFFATVLLSIHFAAGGRRSPGKRLAKVQIVTRTGTPPGLHRAARRELWKFAPLLLGNVGFLLVTIVLALQGPDSLTDAVAAARSATTDSADTLLIALSLGIGAALLWWLLPFLLWRGQTVYDRIADCVVRRA